MRVSHAQRKAVGTRFENRVCDVLRTAGYYVQRSAGSGGIADIIALSNSETLLIQCKRGGHIPISEWNALWAVAQDVRAKAVLAESGETIEHVRLWVLTGPREPRQAVNGCRSLWIVFAAP